MYYSHLRMSSLMMSRTWTQVNKVNSSQTTLKNTSSILLNHKSTLNQKCLLVRNTPDFTTRQSFNTNRGQNEDEPIKSEKELMKLGLDIKKFKYKAVFLSVTLFGLFAYGVTDNDEHLDLGKLKIDAPIPEIKIRIHDFSIINWFPLVKKIFGVLPDNIRQSIGIKMVSV